MTHENQAMNIDDITKKLEKLNERVIRKEKILVFNFNTIYNDSLFILFYYFRNYKTKIIQERGINFKDFTDHEIMSYLVESPYFNALTNWLELDVDSDSKETVEDFLELSQRLLSISYNSEKSELYYAFKTFYELGDITILGPTRAEENARDLALYKDIKFEGCSFAQMFDPKFVLKKIEETEATLIIHPYLRVISSVAPCLYDKTFMFPVIGYNFLDGYWEFKEPIDNEKINKYTIEYGHEFIEFWPFEIKQNEVAYGFDKESNIHKEMIEYCEEKLEKLKEENSNDSNHRTE